MIATYNVGINAILFHLTSPLFCTLHIYKHVLKGWGICTQNLCWQKAVYKHSKTALLLQNAPNVVSQEQHDTKAGCLKQ